MHCFSGGYPKEQPVNLEAIQAAELTLQQAHREL